MSAPDDPPGKRKRRRTEMAQYWSSSRGGQEAANTKRMDTRRRKRAADAAAGDMEGNRSRTDFAGAAARKAARKRRSNPDRSVPHRVKGERGTFPGSPSPPKPPAILVLLPELTGRLEDAPNPVYGQYPRGFIEKLVPRMECDRRDILHVCSGCLPPGEGIRVDIRPEAKPDIVADGRALPFADGSIKAVMIDPPYTSHYATELYGVEYPRPAHLMAEAARVVRPGGIIAFIHYIQPKPPPGTVFEIAFGVSTGFDMPCRVVTLYRKNHALLPGVV